MNKLTILIAAFAMCLDAFAAQNIRENFVDSLLASMTISEKIGQLNQLNCNAVDSATLELVRQGGVGSFLNAGSLENANRLQQAALESRTAIPLIIARDVIHGYRTIFPIPVGQAATFDPALIEMGARVAAVEATADGIRWTFAPMLDIARDARWGRIAESLGEDTYLVSELGRAMVRGFQTADVSSPEAMAACAKHFVGYGASEGGRDYNSTWVPERQLRNVYLPPFEAAFEEGALSVMSSFNSNDGIPSTGNKYLLRDILRDEMGFDGLVVSDWNSVGEMIVHGFAADGADAAAIALKAGLDMDMNSLLYPSHLRQLLDEGRITEAEIDTAVRNVLNMKVQLGLFENALPPERKHMPFYEQTHLEAAREAACKSAILLKNDGVLPLSHDTKIALIGPMADAARDQLGTWTMDGEPEYTVTILDALKEFPENKDITVKYDSVLESVLDCDTISFNRLEKICIDVDAIIVCVGESAALSGEAHSLSCINLAGAQSQLIKCASRFGVPVVVVVMAGRPLTIERDLPNVNALLFCFHPGTMGGPAIADLLFGRQSPSGRLPVTFVREVGQIPMYYNHDNTGRPAMGKLGCIYDLGEQTSAGDVSRYLDSGNEPLFPFGFGLTYTTFEYSPTTVLTGDSIIVSATLTNVGHRTCTETVQLYVQDCVGSITRPVKELKGFRRVTLVPGESCEVSFILKPEDLSFYGLDSTSKITEPGHFRVGICSDSSCPLTASFDL
ncbi:MAG: glycoside hydrolase family 3 C-terminal domain-containing protein [Muribaculaceae bacterium]|nr:glycoside hydrolase family 3 C-terminal domain-containing protein [Muribaculaceae bacterium]